MFVESFEIDSYTFEAVVAGEPFVQIYGEFEVSFQDKVAYPYITNVYNYYTHKPITDKKMLKLLQEELDKQSGQYFDSWYEDYYS